MGSDLNLSRAEIQTLFSNLSVSISKVDSLTFCLREEMSEKIILNEKVNVLKIELSDLELQQELCGQKLSESFQKVNALSSKSSKSKIR